MKKITQQGFTLFELLIVVGIIGLLTSILIVNYNSSKVKARDAKRISDIKKIQADLALYRDKNGYYPHSAATLTWCDCFVDLYQVVTHKPVAPQPPDGNCIASENNYLYKSLDGTSYGLTFCLGQNTAQYKSGYSFAYKDIFTPRFDANRNGILEPLTQTTYPDPTGDPNFIAECKVSLHLSLCTPVEFLDINNSGVVSSTDASCLANVINKVLQGQHPDPSDPMICTPGNG